MNQQKHFGDLKVGETFFWGQDSQKRSWQFEKTENHRDQEYLKVNSALLEQGRKTLNVFFPDDLPVECVPILQIPNKFSCGPIVDVEAVA